MGYKFGSKSLRFMKGVNDDLQECAKRALAKSKYDMTIAYRGGLRTAAVQNEIFEEGNSKCDGYKEKSYHQSGNAIDIIPVGDIAEAYKNTRVLNYFSRLLMTEWQLMLACGEVTGYMVWGGTFGKSGWDKPHHEVHI